MGVRREAPRSLQDPFPSPERGRPGARISCPTPGVSLPPSGTDSPGGLAAVSSAWREVRPGLVFRGDYHPQHTPETSTRISVHSKNGPEKWGPGAEPEAQAGQRCV